MLEFHAWSTARPSLENDKNADELEQEINTLLETEKEQGRSSALQFLIGMPMFLVAYVPWSTDSHFWPDTANYWYPRSTTTACWLCLPTQRENPATPQRICRTNQDCSRCPHWIGPIGSSAWTLLSPRVSRRPGIYVDGIIARRCNLSSVSFPDNVRI